MPSPTSIRRARAATGLLVAVLLLAGCASGSSAAEAPSGRSSNHPDPGPVTFAVVGDSITEWSTLEPGLSSWVATARAARVLLAGGWAVSGATTEDMLDAVDAVPDADVLVIMAGTNDFVPDQPDYELDSSLERIVEIAESTGIDRVVLSAIAPNDLRPDQTEEFNEGLESVALRNGWTWLDPWTFVRDREGGFVAGVSKDGIHPSTQIEMKVGTLLRGAILESALEPRP